MCCGMPEDMYDLVVIADDPAVVGAAFAEAFLARDRRERVAVVLPRDPQSRRLRDHLDLSEIVLIEGQARIEDAHYLDVEGRLLYGERIISAPTAADAGAALSV